MKTESFFKIESFFFLHRGLCEEVNIVAGHVHMKPLFIHSVQEAHQLRFPWLVLKTIIHPWLFLQHYLYTVLEVVTTIKDKNKELNFGSDGVLSR